MNQISRDQLTSIRQFAFDDASKDHSGHGVDHLKRVEQLIHTISQKEENDESISVAAGLLHDVIDDKLTNDPVAKLTQVNQFLVRLNISNPVIDEINLTINNMSFSKTLTDQQVELSLAGKVVQDADRLDAIGALGIGRAFYYSGKVGEAMYDPQKKPRMHMTKEQYRHEPGTTINHFYEKLLLIVDQLNTITARKIGQHRQQVMLKFIAEFKDEWEEIIPDDGDEK
ncbi:HD domain-containing protein [Paucilactobacillus suebicus]|nr:HD domain-containing protein [Paucilactobacillus suebicus]